MEEKILGVVLMIISMIFSLADIFLFNITGAVIGAGMKSSLLIVLSLVFFFLGLLFLSRIGKGLVALVLAGATVVGGAGVSHKINLNRENQYLTDTKVTASYKTNKGKFQRTYRWDETLDIIEDKYNIPKGTLKGLIMRESYGDPLRLNEGADGGAGLFMFQPRTAKAYGLKIYGSSDRSSADYKHGAELKKLIKKNNYNYEKMAKIDERFDIIKSSDAAARFLNDLYKKYGSWDKALSAYNQGKPAPNPENTEHVKKTWEYRDYYNQRDKMNHKYVAPKTNNKKYISKKGKR
jgi:hypothetical protein